MQTSTERPRFRQDLVAEPIEDGATRFIDVMDPDSGTLYRFFEVEYSLACAMDGQRDIAGIVKWADEELGLKTSAKEVNNVIATLGDLGYLERGAAAAAAANAAAAAVGSAAAAARPAKSPTPAAGVKKQPDQPGANRWDQPTAMGDADQYLQKGVVHGGGRAATPAPDVELGKAGTRPAQAAEMPRGDVELGAPGAAAAAARAGGKAENIPLGKPGRSENVEVDLAADMPLSKDAVKEAVRQSQVMKSVDVPPEHAAVVSPPAAKVETRAEAKASAKAAARAEPQPVAKAEPKAEPRAAAKAETRPAPTPSAAEQRRDQPRARTDSKVPVAPRGTSPVLIAALVLAILAAGGYALWKFVLNKKETPQTSAKPTPPAPTPQPPPPPPVETAKLVTEAPVAEEIKPVAAGQVATIVANDTAVKEGDPIARLVGFKPVEAQVTTIDKALIKAKDAATAAEKERDAAQTAGNKNGVTAAEKKLTAAQKTITDQEAKLATAKAALDKFLIKSPGPGKVTAVAKANAKVSPTDVIATLTRDAVVTATFKTAGEVAVGTRVLLAVKGSDQKLSCTVAQTGGDGIKIACPMGAAADGAEVTYAGVDPNAPPPGETPPGETPPGATPPGGTPPPTGDTPKPEDQKAGSGSEAAKPEDKKPEDKKPAGEPKAEKKATPRPRPRPQPKPPVDKPAGSGETGSAPADKPADKPVDPPPAPAGSATP
jgi:hypothetical protein